jgi:tetratricopeptide (TPR) repeat protein
VEDPKEMNWAILGHLVRETRFLLVVRRLYFMKFLWNVPVNESLPEALRLTEGHPYNSYIQSFGLPPAQAIELLAKLKLRDFDYRQLLMFKIVNDYQRNQFLILTSSAMDRHENVYSDLLLMWTGYAAASNKMDWVKKVLRVSPDAPTAHAMWLLSPEPFSAEKLAEIEKRYSGHAAVMRSLGTRYSGGNKYADAERVLKQLVKLSPGTTAYQLLAGCFKKQGKADLWKATLDEFINTEPQTLMQDQARCDIAYHLLAQKRHREALEYADRAAESFASWAMLCATECNEAAGEWAKAELWVRRRAERYPSNVPHWYLWCLRTGKGDLKAARKAGLDFPEEDLNLTTLIVVKTAEGDLKGAIKYIEAARQQNPNHPDLRMLLALSHDDLEQKEKRDKVLALSDSKLPTVGVLALAPLFQKCLASGENAALDLEVIEQLSNNFRGEPAEKSRFDYFVGRFLWRRGDVANSRKYLQQCASQLDADPSFRTLAAVLLRTLDEK